MIHGEYVDGHGGVAISSLERPVACIKDPRISVYALITSGSSCVLRDFRPSKKNRIPGCRLCSSVLFHGWLVAAVAKVEYVFINTLVRIDVSQGINLTLVEVLVNLLRILFMPLHEVLEAFLGNLEFFFCFSFTPFAVEIDLLEVLVELGEIVRIEVLHRDPVFNNSFPGGFYSWLVIIAPVSGMPSFLGLGGCVLLRLVLV